MANGKKSWFDFTLDGSYEQPKIKQMLVETCKKWGFQKEKGEETNYIHYQGKLEFITSQSLTSAVELFQSYGFSKGHLEPSHQIGQWNYVTKEETRIDGPWLWNDPVIPKWLANENPEWYPWQKDVIAFKPEERKVHVIVDPYGNTGKSYLANWLAVRRFACKIPVIGTYKDVMRAIYDRPPSERYFLDIPRAEQLNAPTISAIESIKDGHIWDDRYKFEEKWIEPPVVVVFTNAMPKIDKLSHDRWKIHTITQKRLVVKTNF